MKQIALIAVPIGLGAYVLMNWNALTTFVGIVLAVGPGFGPS